MSSRSIGLGVALAAILATGCARRMYDGPDLPSDQVAVVEVGDVSIRNIDGRYDFIAPFAMKRFEVRPGRHRVVFVFERQAGTIGVRDVPYRLGEGICTIEFVAEAGKLYRLEAEPLGADTNTPRWDGRWEGWLRDTSLDYGDDIVARCSPEDEAKQARKADRPEAPRAAAAPPPPVVAPAPVVAPPALPAPVALPERKRVDWIRLGTWNVRSLGTDADRNYAALADAIERTFDVATLTEVARVDGAVPGFERLMAALGSGWSGVTAATGNESYAIVYRNDRVRPCDGWSALRAIVDSGSFERPPAFGCFEVAFGSDPAGFDFLLAAYRATSAGGDVDAVAAEVRNVDRVFQEMSRARSGEKDLILAGQLNLETVELQTLTKAAIRTSGDGAALNLLGEPTYGLRQHILVHDSAATAEIIGNGTVIDVRDVAASPKEFRRTVSDHLPVMVRIRTTGPDDD